MSLPARIGQYRIVRKIGAGGMGTVYVGEHLLLGRHAAIKTLLPTLSVYPEIVERFFNEARATSGINDHGVVQVFDFGYHVDGTAYIVMELLEGESLKERIDRVGRLPPTQAVRIARQVASSLASAHACGIVHRDLKPENVFLIRDPEAHGGERTKVLDFGICKLGVDDARTTQSGTTMGTPVYMSPEQCRGAGSVDGRADVYALGGVLFHMLVGRPPFEAEGAGDYIVAHLQQTPPAPTSLVPELPAALDPVLARCLEKSPSARFQSMTELAEELERVLSALGAPSLETSSVPPAPSHEVAGGTKLPVRFAGEAWLSASTPPANAAGAGAQEAGARGSRRALLVFALLACAAASTGAWIYTERDGSRAHASATTTPATTTATSSLATETSADVGARPFVRFDAVPSGGDVEIDLADIELDGDGLEPAPTSPAGADELAVQVDAAEATPTAKSRPPRVERLGHAPRLARTKPVSPPPASSPASSPKLSPPEIALSPDEPVLAPAVAPSSMDELPEEATPATTPGREVTPATTSELTPGDPTPDPTPDPMPEPPSAPAHETSPEPVEAKPTPVESIEELYDSR